MMEAIAHGLAGSTGGVAAMLLLYPLDNVRTRLQVQIKEKKKLKIEVNGIEVNGKIETNGKEKNENISNNTVNGKEIIQYPQFKGSIDCIKHVIEKEGWQGLYSGLSSGLVGISLSQSIYFFWYYIFKTWSLKKLEQKHLSPIQNLVVAAAAGVVNVFLTLPIWVINTRMKLQSQEESKYRGNLDALIRIYKSEGFNGLFQGLIPSLILVSNPAIQFMAYEQLSKVAYLVRKSRGLSTELTSIEHFLWGALAKALATVVTYPYQVVKSRLQAEETSKLYTGTFDATQKMFRNEGISAFYLGMESKMYQTVLNSAFMFVVYEKLVGFFISLTKYLSEQSSSTYRIYIITICFFILIYKIIIPRIQQEIKKNKKKTTTKTV